MFAAARRTRIGLSCTALVAVPFVLAACGGDKAKATPISTTESSSVSNGTMVPVSNTTLGGAPGGSSTRATYESADAAYKAGDFPVAAEMFKASVASKPDDALGLYMLGLSSWKAGDFEGAKMSFDKSIELNPAFAKSYFNEARVLLDLKRAPEAIERIEKGRSIDSTSPDGWRLMARAQAANGDVDGAMETYHELLTRNEEDTWGLNNLGMTFFDGGDFHGAVGPLARVVQLLPTSPVFQNNLGMALERSGYPITALGHYEQAVHNDSSYTKAVKNAERLRGIVTDSTNTAEVDVQALAEAFRLEVRTWQEAMVPVTAPEVIAKPDTGGTAVTTADPIK